VGDEMFLKESDLVDGKCPNHPNMTPIEIEEENYFFKLSNYQEKLARVPRNREFICPSGAGRGLTL
jgi:methionyl-tRNA synthetase